MRPEPLSSGNAQTLARLVDEVKRIFFPSGDTATFVSCPVPVVRRTGPSVSCPVDGSTAMRQTFLVSAANPSK